MPVRLTEAAIRSALTKARETGRRDLADAALPGLRLRLTPAGSATWALACRDPQGRMRRFALGSFPAMGMAEAREKARVLRVRVRDGADPVADRRRVRAAGQDAREGVGTLRHLLDLYGGPVRSPPPGAPDLRRGPARSGARAASEARSRNPGPAGPGAGLKSWPTGRARMERVFAGVLDQPLGSLAPADLQLLADRYPAKQIAASAVRCLRPVLKWGAARGLVAEATARVSPPAVVRRRDRVLAAGELARVLPPLRAAADPYRRAMLFMLLTLARREEVCAARWGDVDLAGAEWRIPATKNGTSHRLPLSRQATEVLRAAGPGDPGALVFRTPAKRGSEGRLVNWDRETKRLMRETGTAGWTRHDLRRTGATLLGEVGVEPHVIEAALNHAAIHSRLAATYNRARYLPAVREALQTLADRLDAIAEGGPDSA
jgi:integrase